MTSRDGEGGTRERWAWQQTTADELGSQFLGRFIVIAFGDGVVVMVAAPGSIFAPFPGKDSARGGVRLPGRR